MTRPAPIIVGTLAALLLLFGAYMGGYYVMLSGMTYQFSSTTAPIQPQYRAGSKVTAMLLKPAHQIDRLIRPRDWHWPRTYVDPSD